MKLRFAKLTLAGLTLVATAALHAKNTEAIAYGRATVVLTPAVLQQLAAHRISVTDLSRAPLHAGANVLPALEGAIDLDTSFNEVVYGGGYVFTVGSNVIQIRSLTLDLVGPSAVFSGIVIKNGAFVGREAIFSIIALGGPPPLPIVPVNGTISHNGLSLSFEEPFISLINAAAGDTGLNTTTQIATLDLYSVLAPLSGSGSWPPPPPYPW